MMRSIITLMRSDDLAGLRKQSCRYIRGYYNERNIKGIGNTKELQGI